MALILSQRIKNAQSVRGTGKKVDATTAAAKSENRAPISAELQARLNSGPKRGSLSGYRPRSNGTAAPKQPQVDSVNIEDLNRLHHDYAVKLANQKRPKGRMSTIFAGATGLFSSPSVSRTGLMGA